MLPVDVEECPVWLFDGMSLLQPFVVVPETFGSLAQELFDRMSMLAKNAARFDFAVDSVPPSLSKMLNSSRLWQGPRHKIG